MPQCAREFPGVCLCLWVLLPRFLLCSGAAMFESNPMSDPTYLDQVDPLARFRSEFYLPPGQIYLDGNSLGLLSRWVGASLLRAIATWRPLGISGGPEAGPPRLTL